jgi:antitoxin component YwqK of YwqJK toxin-antitoxin module
VSVFLIISLLSDFLFGKKDGPFESYYRSGQLKEKGTYRDGELEGLSEEYYKNGQLSEKGTYKDGEPHGPFEGYSKNGQLEWKGTYNMGEECGEWIEDGETVTYDPCPPDLEDAV